MKHYQQVASPFTSGAVIATTLLLSACSGGGGGEDYSPLSLSITDAPVDSATAVVVEFTGIEFKPADGEKFSVEFEEPRQIDLYALRGGEAAILLDSLDVPSGKYNYARLKINAEEGLTDSFINFEDGSSFSLHIPSGAQTGLKLVQGFVVPVNGSASFMIDFDLRKSVVNPQGSGTPSDYFLKPSLRLINLAASGHIAGTVDSSLIEGEGCGDSSAVYAYEGFSAEPDDVGSSNSPIASASVELNEETGLYNYQVSYLVPGDYTVALTCMADQDNPEVDDALEFIDSLNATVENTLTAEANFSTGG